MTALTLTKHLTNWKGLFQNCVRTFLINNFWTRSLVFYTLHLLEKKFCRADDCVKSVYIWSLSGPYFPAFGLNIQSECGEIRARKTLNTGAFHAVDMLIVLFH